MWLAVVVLCSPVDYVDPLIGTKYAEVGQGVGKVFPAVTPPFGMTQWTPVTNEPSLEPGNWYPSPYYYDGPESPPAIIGFRGTHFPSGSCMCDYGAFELMVVTGSLKFLPEDRKSVFSHSNENATPYYYSVHLDTWNVDVEMTATTRCAVFRFTFHEATTAYFIVDTLGVNHGGGVSIDTGNRKITGWDNDRYKDSFTGYFSLQFDTSFDDYGVWNRDGTSNSGTTSASWTSNAGGAYVAINVVAGQQVIVKAGTSFVSIAKADSNLSNEVSSLDFDTVMANLKSTWENYLSKIEVVSAPEDKKKMLYTALYHILLLPRIFTDHDGQYRSPYNNNTYYGNYYSDYSIWDTYRGVHTLFCLLYPDENSKFIEGLLRVYQEGEWLPKWPNPYYTNVMIGTHADSIIAEAKIKGISIWDEDLAYEALIKDANVSTYYSGGGGTTTGPVLYQARWALDSYLAHHYVSADWNKPADGYTQAVSRTLEYAYDDYCVARMAQALGKTDDYETFLNRSFWYRNLFDPETGFMRPRHDDGSWYEPFDPAVSCLGGYYTESTPWVYTFHVQHDPQGLLNLFGGKEEFTEKLDEFFDGGFFDPTNEPSMHIPYLYVWAGKPWKTQYRVHEAISNYFGTEPLSGLPGDEDCGQMSAYLLFSMLGFYPVSPVDTYYVIGTPMLEKVVLHLPNGKDFTIVAHDVSDTNIYIQKAELNGSPLERAWITHDEIMNGGTLEFWMGPQPNKNWGADNPPPSASDGEPVFEVTDVHISKQVAVAGEPIVAVAHVKNTKFAVGTFDFEVKLGDKVLSSKKFVFGPSGTPDGDDEQDLSVEFTIYVPGTYDLQIAGKHLRVVVNAGAPKLVYKSLSVERDGLDNLTFHINLANEGGWWASDSLSVKLDGVTVAEETVEVSPGESKSESLQVENVKGGNHTLKVTGFDSTYIKVPGGVSLFKGEPFWLDGLSFYLPLDEGSGNETRDEVSLSTGDIQGSASWTSGKYGKALQFDGSSSYIEFENCPALNPTKSISVEAWIYPVDWNGNRRILQKGVNDNQYRFLAEGGVFKFDIYGVGTVTAPLPSSGTWHHVVGVYSGDNGTMEIWVDGVRTGQIVVTPAPIPVTDDPLYVGTKTPFAPPGDHFYGTIDEVRIYSRALKPEEIALLSSVPADTSGIYSTGWVKVSKPFRRFLCFSSVPAGCSLRLNFYTSDDGVTVKDSVGPLNIPDGSFEKILNLTQASYFKVEFTLVSTVSGLSPHVLAFAVELSDGTSEIWDSFSEFSRGYFENTTAGYVPSSGGYSLNLIDSKKDAEVWFGVEDFPAYYVAKCRGLFPALGTFVESSLLDEDFSDVSDWLLESCSKDETRGYEDFYSLRFNGNGLARSSSEWNFSAGSVYRMTLYAITRGGLSFSLYPERAWNEGIASHEWVQLLYYVQPKYGLTGSFQIESGESGVCIDKLHLSRIDSSSSGFNLTSPVLYLDIDQIYETSFSDSYVVVEYEGQEPEVFYSGADTLSFGKKKATLLYSTEALSGRMYSLYRIENAVFGNLLENGADLIVVGNGRISGVWVSRNNPFPSSPSLTQQPGGIYVGLPSSGEYRVYRKFKDRWVFVGQYLYPGFLDSDVEKGGVYSYRVARVMNGYSSPLSKESSVKADSVLEEGGVVLENQVVFVGETVRFMVNFGSGGSVMKVDVFSLSGVKVHSESRADTGIKEIAFSTKGLAPGIYIARVRVGETSKDFRIVLRRSLEK